MRPVQFGMRIDRWGFSFIARSGRKPGLVSIDPRYALPADRSRLRRVGVAAREDGYLRLQGRGEMNRASRQLLE